MDLDSQFIASTVEFCAAVLNIIITLAYYWKKDLTVINYWHILFGIVLLSNQVITMIMEFNGHTTDYCFMWYIQVSAVNLGNHKKLC